MIGAGIDVGTSSIKIAVVSENGSGSDKVLATSVERIRRREPGTVAKEMYEIALRDADVRREDLEYVATTGEGEMIDFRTGHFYSMTAHARGALFLDPEARAVIDVGSLHARAILIDERAKVLGSRMTSQCASGSGQFLENISRYLGVTIEEIGPLSLEADAPEPCSSICAVLAETDVINMVSRNITVSNIIKGIHESMAGRYHKLLTSAGASGRVLLTGGLARDTGLLAALREASDRSVPRLDIRIHESSILAGALGAAFWGLYRARKLKERGLSLTADAP